MTLASAADWLHDETIAEHGKAAKTQLESESKEPSVPQHVVLSVDLPTVSCRVLQVASTLHGHTHVSKVSVLCLVIQEVKLLGDISPPLFEDSDGVQTREFARKEVPAGSEHQFPQHVLASVNVKSVHAQLCSQDKQVSGLAPDMSKVCFSLDSPFAQFGDGPAVQSSILFELGVERLHVALQRKTKLRLSEPNNSETTMAASPAVRAIPHQSSGRHQSVLANPAALVSIEQDSNASPQDIFSADSYPLLPRNSSRPQSSLSSAMSAVLEKDVVNETEVFGAISGVWVQLPSAPDPKDAVAGLELPINVVSAVNLMLDVWQQPISNFVTRGKQIAEEAEKIRSHAACLLLQELLISNVPEREV